VVSEHPNLFDAAIAENIWYGNQANSDYDICCAATTMMVMHKLEVMMMCDRIVVVDGGVREQGTYNELMKRKGVFASLASEGKRVGEW
jgi:ABC-type multidrug transport system fused ATPase/permease subunit